MYEFLSAPDDVIAFRCRGKVEQAGLLALLDRIESSIATREKTHLFVEIENFSGFETDGFADLTRRSAALLKQLDRIGRVAVVADQAWIRWAAKLESAVLPHVTYETFESRERERALAWVKGEETRPHGPAIKVIETSRPDVFGFELDGRATKKELDALANHFNAKLNAVAGTGPVRMLGRIRSIGGFEMSGLVSQDYFAMKRGFLDRLDRYAVVGGPAWLKAMTTTLAPLFRAELRWFDEDEEEAAWEWLEAEPLAERSLVA